MLETVVDDVLEMIARAAVRRCAEIDDAAMTAASLALTSRRVSAVMASVAWKEVSARAELMEPFVEAMAVKSACEVKTARKKDLTAIAVSAKLHRAKTMTLAELEEALDKGDQLVGTACPIPVAAAAYIQRMSFRWMPVRIAVAKFGDRDLDTCEFRNSCYRYRDLRRAPKMPPHVDEDRRKALEFLDALFTPEKPRPWWVRTMAAADQHFRREKLIADGYPISVAKWDVPDAELRDFRDVCNHLDVKMLDFSLTHRPDWYRLRCKAMEGTHKAFMLCGDALPFASQFRVDDVEHVRAKMADAMHSIRDVTEPTLDASYRVIQGWMPVRATILVATAAILLKHAGLPMAPAWWRIDDGREVLYDLARDALEVSRLLSIPIHYAIDDFAAAVKAEVKKALGDEAEPPEPGNGRFITSQQYLTIDSSWPPKKR
jgi:hypothetical protein